MSLQTLKQVSASGKRVLLRADLDVPVKNGTVSEDYRLRALIPTLKSLLGKKGTKVLIMGHLGRPGGRKKPELSLKPVASHFERLIDQKIRFFEDYEFLTTDSTLAMLENLRFWSGEEGNDPSFAKKIAVQGDIYINEAFSACHRNHASIVGVPKFLPACGGLRLEQEVRELEGVLKKPKRPLIFILGGAKSETKAPLVRSFAEIADGVLLGGLLMFHKELEGIPGVLFPVDATDAYDIGPKSVKLFAEEIAKAKTVVWNGPMGVWEDNRYELGTRALAEELASLKARVIVGGGDTIAALDAFGLLNKMDYVSLGGGAMLEFLAGKKLPGLEVLGYY